MNLGTEFPLSSPLTSALFIPQSLRTSSIEDVLNRPDLKLEELLDDQDFGFELKNGNPKLHDYFARNPDKIKQLVDYITQVPPDMNDEKRAYKYPLAANEAFEADVNSIMLAFFSDNQSPSSSLNGSPQRRLTDTFDSFDIMSPNILNRSKLDGSPSFSSHGSESGQKSLLRHLFAYLSQKGDLNPVLAGYSNSLIKKLWRRNTKKMVEFVYSDERIMTDAVEHICEQSVAELVALFMTYEGYLFDEKKPEYTEIKLRTVDKIINKIANGNNSDDLVHIGEIFNELLNKSDTMADGKEIKNKIHSRDTIDKMFRALREGAPSNIIINICNILAVAVDYYNKKRCLPSSPIKDPSFSFGNGVLDNDFMTEAICLNMSGLARLLLSERDGRGFQTSFSQNVKPLGLGKLKIVELIEKIVRIDNKSVYSKISEAGILKILTDLFAKHIWNNMLHNAYEKLVYTILDRRDSILLDALFERAGFIRLMIRELKEDQVELLKKGKKIKKGNIGFVVKMTNELIRISSFDKVIESCLRREPEWESVVNGNLKNKNELNNQEIGGKHPRQIYAELGILPETSSFADAPSPHPNSAGKRDSLSFFSQAEQQQKVEETSPGLQSPTAGSFLDLTHEPASPEIKSNSVPFQPTPSGYSNLGAFDQLYPNIGNSPMVRHSVDSTFSPMASNNSQSGPNIYGSFSQSMDQFRIGVQAPQKIEIKPFEYKPDSLKLTTKDIFSPDLNPPKVELSPITHSPSIENPAIGRQWELTKEAEDNYGALTRSGVGAYSAPVSTNNSLRNSMIDLRPENKIKLAIKKDTKLDANRILGMINRSRDPTKKMSADFTYSDHSFSEAENLVDDSDSTIPMQPLPMQVRSGIGFLSYNGKGEMINRGYY